MADLCVTIARRRHRKALEELEAADAAGVRLVELRLDYLAQEPRLGDFIRHRRCPMIATIRRKDDGGMWSGTETERRKLLRSAIVAGFDYVDLEHDIAGSIARYGSTRRIVSIHDFRGMPEDLSALHARLKACDADVVKVAARVNHPAENFRLLRLIRKADIPTVAIGMGDLGSPSRILGAKFGSPFTYAAFGADRLVAPGILTLEQMREIYRYESIDADTEIYGVIGDPIVQSLSPLVHNAAYEALRLNKVYVPFRVPSGTLDAFLREVKKAEVGGLSVTIPHKEGVLAFGDPVDPIVARTKSANTLVRRKDGGYDLYNTDARAALDAILEGLKAMHPELADPLVGRTALILGAGGVARTLAFALRDNKALVTIANRTADKAHRLAAEVGCTFVDWAERHAGHHDLVINGTKVGMVPNAGGSPYHAGSLAAGMLVFDTVYNPESTQLILDARSRGVTTVTGVEMFVRQAEAQFRLFTGQAPPAGLMASLVREELSPARNMLRQARLGKIAVDDAGNAPVAPAPADEESR